MSSSVGRSPGHALVWSFANTLGSKLGGLAIGIVLARVLGPEEFGSYAVAFIALMAILAFNDLGVSLAVVRWPGPPALIVGTVNTVSIGSSLLLSCVVLVAAGPFAAAMGDPGSADLVRVLGLCIVINGVVATPAALLQRSFRSDLRTMADQVNVWLGAAVSLLFAAAGIGAESLVAGRVAGSLVSGAMLLAFSPLPYRVGLDLAVLRRLLSFGVPLAGTSLLVFAIGFVDQISVGHLLGPTALGAYVLAYNLASWPVQVLSQPLRSVAPAILARQQHDAPLMRQTFQRMVPPLAAVALPGCAVLAATAPDVVALVYGEQWSAAAEPLRWLAVFAAFRILAELAYDFVVIAGTSRSLLAVQVLWLVGLAPSVGVGVQLGGLRGAAVAQVLLGCAVVTPAYGILLGRLGVCIPTVVRSLALPAVAAVGLFGAVGLGRTLGLSALQVVLIAGVLMLACVAFLMHRVRGCVVVWRTTPAEPVIAAVA